jgi:hypothetical protein
MVSLATYDEYLNEVREQVCSRCVERPPGGPPCLPLGKRCGIELHLPAYLRAVHEVESASIVPYLASLEKCVCTNCPMHHGESCPCPLEYLLVLTVQAIETVDQRHAEDSAARTTTVGC